MILSHFHAYIIYQKRIRAARSLMHAMLTQPSLVNGIAKHKTQLS